MYWKKNFHNSKQRPGATGVKVGTRGHGRETRWSRRLLEVLESFGIGPKMLSGRSYARRGLVADLMVRPGLVTAWVQGEHATPYEARISLKTFTDEEWQHVESILAEQALFLAHLLAGEMPCEIETFFNSCHLSIFPRNLEELDMDCTCADWAMAPCPHVAAVLWVLADRIDEDPFLLLALRGRTREALASISRSHRQDESDLSTATISIEPARSQDTQPLSAFIHNYWKMGRNLSSLRIQPRAVPVPQAILRQLGASGIECRSADIHDVLAPAFVVMTRAAELRAYEEETEMSKSE